MEYTGKAWRKRPIPILPIDTARASTALQSLNNLIEESPEYRTTIYCLVSYPIIKWIVDNHTDNVPSLDTVRNLYLQADAMGVETPAGVFYNVHREGIFDCYKELIDTMDESFAWLASAGKQGERSANAIKYIHLKNQGEMEDLTNFKMRSYYLNGVRFFWGNANRALTEIVERMNKLAENQDVLFTGVLNPAYSNISYLFDFYECFADPAMSNIKEMYEVKEQLAAGVKAFADSPKDAEQLSLMMGEIISGNCSANGLCKACDMSPNCVKRYKNEALHMLAALMYGYTVEELIDLLYVARSKKLRQKEEE